MSSTASDPGFSHAFDMAEQPAFMGRSPVSAATAAPASAPARADWISGMWQAAPDGILLVNKAGEIVSSNLAMSLISGYAESELIGASIDIFLPDSLRALHQAHLHQFFTQPRRQSMSMGRTLWLQRKDGTQVPVGITLGNVEREGALLALAFVRDMTDMYRMEERMRYQATHDTLTGLKNRWAFNQSLQEHLQQALASGEPFALLLLDLDNFKAINDGYGHAAGDYVLQEVAKRLQAVLRSHATLARLGGDEFTALVTSCVQAHKAQSWAEQILSALKAPCQWDDVQLELSASIGVAMVPQDAVDASTLMRYADMAMYRAKESGRSNFAFYEENMGHDMAEKVLLSERLRVALGYDGLKLYFQPQMDLATGKVCGAEALLRWHDPVLGDISPDRFIPVAEANGLILNVGSYVLDMACQQIRQWIDEGKPLRIAVNLSAQQLRQRTVVDTVRMALQRHQVPAQWLELEVTESQAMQDPEQACQTLHALAALGVRLALDDFGNGHSCLAYLRHLPVQRIKLGKDFIQHAGRGAQLLGAVIALGHAMDMEVVAEGVETQAQCDELKNLGCDYYQGWFSSKALTAAQFDVWRQGR